MKSAALTVVLLTMLAAAAAAPACGGDGDERAAGATAGGGATGKAASGGQAGRSGAGNVAGSSGAGASSGEAGVAGTAGSGACGPSPSTAPAGWEEVAPGEWSCACRMFRDPHPELSDTWSWTNTCPSDAPSGVACEGLIEPPINGLPAWSTTTRGTDADGSLVVGWRRYFQSEDAGKGRFFHVIDPTTGRSRLSLYTTYLPNAQALQEDSSRSGRLVGGKLVVGFYGNGGQKDPEAPGFGYGARVVSIDATVAPFTWKAEVLYSYSVSSAGLLTHRGELLQRPFDSSPDVTVYSPSNDPEGLSGYYAAVRGAEIMIEVGNAGVNGYYSWTPTDGLRAILRAPFDIKKAWGALGSDGKDLVWTYGEGQPTTEYKYPKFTMYTAPWSTDPAKLAATARSLGDNFFGEHFAGQFVVGCGYAAQSNVKGLDPSGKDGFANVEIIRLSTGERWLIKNNSPLGALTIGAVTCDHVYLTVPPRRQVRVRLDSLGPSSPAPL